MNRKHALIVDDSKTAQYLLKRMLQKYELVVDVVSSAAEALSYLSYNHPVAIFLDHQMTGMTGIEALKTIKANPNTAQIPVIMYTSQTEDAFVSRATALGAHGMLSKNMLQSANLQKMLEGLNVRARSGGQDDRAESVDATPTEPAAAVTDVAGAIKSSELADLDRVQSQIGRIFEIYIADIRSQINTSAQFVLKRLSANIERAGNREAHLGANSLATIKSVVASAVAAERRKRSSSIRWLLGLMLAAMGGFVFLLVQIQADSEASSQKILAALEAKNASKAAAVPPPPPVAAINPSTMPAPLQTGMPSAAAPQAIHPALLQAISLAQNADFGFEYGEQPLSGARLSNLNQLINLLADGGYRGTLTLNINIGNFCLEGDETISLRPARAELKIGACKMQKDLNQRFLADDYVTPQFQAFERSTAPLRDGRINIRLATNGTATPHVDYPIATVQTTAGEWNRAALRNNRVAVQFLN